MTKRITKGQTPRQTASDGYAVPRELTPASKGQRLPQMPNNMFQLIAWHSPTDWELVGDELLPVIKFQPLAPGTNGVRARKEPDPPDPALLISALQRDGNVVFTDLSTYNVEYDAAHGVAYFLRWDRVKIYDDGEWEVHHDAEGFDAWRRSLVDDGVIPQPRARAVETLRRQGRRRREQAERHHHLPAAQRAAADAEDWLGGLEAAIERGASKWPPPLSYQPPPSPRP